MAVPLALVSVVAGIAPELVRWLVGERAGTVADRAAEVITSIAGSTADADVRLAMADPARAADMRLELARLAAEQEREEREAELERMRAMLADVAGARGQTVELAKAGSAIAWSAPVVSVLVVIAFGSMLCIVMTQAIPEQSMPLANVLLGTLAAAFGQVIHYWLGSSNGSARKDEAIRGELGRLAGR